MTLEYTLTEDDYLQHQLYVASRSKKIKRNRIVGRLLLSGILLSISFYFFKKHNQFAFDYFLVLGILFLVLYPYLQRRHYKRAFRKFINGNYKARFNQPVKAIFSDDEVQITSIASETKYNLQALSQVIETGHHFYVGIKTGGHVIIPKSGINNLEELKNELTGLSQKLIINYTSDLNWKWK